MRKYILELAEPDKESSVLKIYSHTFLFLQPFEEMFWLWNQIYGWLN